MLKNSVRSHIAAVNNKNIKTKGMELLNAGFMAGNTVQLLTPTRYFEKRKPFSMRQLSLKTFIHQ